MYKFLEDTFAAFRNCFSNRRAYHWFVILVTGFMFRDDTFGVTSVIRTLMLDGSCYETMLHFFYSKALCLDGLRQTWYSIVFSSGHVQRANGKYVLVGDVVKTPKEAVRMPGVKKHFQESEDSSKGEYIHGHMFGAIGVVIDKGADSFCVPLRMGIQEGLAEASAWEGSEISGKTMSGR